MKAIVVAIHSLFLAAAVAGVVVSAMVYPVAVADVRWTVAVFGAVCALQVVGFIHIIYQTVRS